MSALKIAIVALATIYLANNVLGLGQTLKPQL